MLKSSLRLRLLPFLIVLALLPILSGFGARFVAVEALKNYTGRSLQLRASSEILQLERILLDWYQRVLTWSKNDALRDVANDDAQGRIQTLFNTWDLYETKNSRIILCVNRAGKVIASNRSKFKGQDVSKRNWFIRVISSPNPVIDDLPVSSEIEPYSLTFAVPVFAEDGKTVIGAVAEIRSAVNVLSVVNNIRFSSSQDQSPEGYAILMDKHGLMLTQPYFEKKDWMLKKNLVDENIFQGKINASGKEGYLIDRDFYGNDALVGYASSQGLSDFPGFRWTILLVLKLSTILEPTQQLTYQVITAGLVTLFIMFLISHFITRNVSGPLASMAEVASAIAEGDFQQRTKFRSSDEVSRLGMSLNKMAERLNKSRGELLAAKEYNDSLIRSAIDTMLAMDRDGKITLCNPAAAELLGYEQHELIGQTFQSVVAAEDYEKSKIGELLRPDTILSILAKAAPEHDELATSLVRGAVANAEMHYKTRAGKLIPMLVSATLIRDPEGNIEGLVVIGKDITRQKEQERELKKIATELEDANKKLEELSHVDPLTELANRRRLQEILTRENAHSKRSGSSLMALLIDLDDFKKVNDGLGHAVGDIVLKECATKLHSAVRASDLVARIGGDEFVVLLPHTRVAEGMLVAERVRMALSEFPIMLSDGKVVVTASIGLIELEDVQSIDELLSKAHAALKRSKKAGKNRVSHGFAPDGSKGEDETEQMLKTIQNPELVYVVKQPIFRTQDRTISGYEFLTRIKLPEFSNPEPFFLKARELNMLTLVDHECFKKGLRAIPQDAGAFRYHLNLFPSTMLAVPASELIKEMPEFHPKDQLCIEISEKQIVGTPLNLLDMVKALREAGIKIAIDDVGFGNSCLESLILLEPEIVKIDKVWVRGIAQDRSILRALERILVVLNNLKTEVIAEGIETEDDFKVVQDLGIGFAQGYYLGMPG